MSSRGSTLVVSRIVLLVFFFLRCALYRILFGVFSFYVRAVAPNEDETTVGGSSTPSSCFTRTGAGANNNDNVVVDAADADADAAVSVFRSVVIIGDVAGATMFVVPVATAGASSSSFVVLSVRTITGSLLLG